MLVLFELTTLILLALDLLPHLTCNPNGNSNELDRNRSSHSHLVYYYFHCTYSMVLQFDYFALICGCGRAGLPASTHSHEADMKYVRSLHIHFLIA